MHYITEVFYMSWLSHWIIQGPHSHLYICLSAFYALSIVVSMNMPHSLVTTGTDHMLKTGQATAGNTAVRPSMVFKIRDNAHSCCAMSIHY